MSAIKKIGVQGLTTENHAKSVGEIVQKICFEPHVNIQLLGRDYIALTILLSFQFRLTSDHSPAKLA